MEPSSQDSSQEGEKQQGLRAGERSKLVQRLLDGGSDLPAFLNDLLATMAVTVAGTEAAGFVIERVEQEFRLKPQAHIRQDESDAQTRAAALDAFQNLVKPCIVQGKDGAIDLGNVAGAESEPQYCLITLLRDGPNIVAVAAVITRCLNLERARQRLLSMQLVAGYFEFFTLKRGAESNKSDGAEPSARAAVVPRCCRCRRVPFGGDESVQRTGQRHRRNPRIARLDQRPAHSV